MAEFTYYIMQNTKVYNPMTGETEEVKAGDEVEHAHLWRNLDALVNTGVVIRQAKDADAPVNPRKGTSQAPVEQVAETQPQLELEVDEPEVDDTVDEPESQRFECPYCDKVYESTGWLDRHVEDKHSDEVE